MFNISCVGIIATSTLPLSLLHVLIHGVNVWYVTKFTKCGSSVMLYRPTLSVCGMPFVCCGRLSGVCDGLFTSWSKSALSYGLVLAGVTVLWNVLLYCVDQVYLVLL